MIRYSCRYLERVRTRTVPLLAGDQVAMSGMLKLAPVNHPWLPLLTPPFLLKLMVMTRVMNRDSGT